MWAAVGSGGHMATTLQSNEVTVLLQPQVTNPVKRAFICPNYPIYTTRFSRHPVRILHRSKKIAKECSTP